VKARRVHTIPAVISRYTAEPINSHRKRRVAGYARVSTDHEDQVTSYEAQVDYYTSYIKGRHDWEFVDIYTDEGISATNTRHRDGFNTMVKDALDNKIDLIITKSVSRFARNTVDSLTTVRKLKDKGIEVYFEKENIWTLDAKGELLITIMSSLAQEESRSISENTTWGQRKRFADGKVSVPFKQFLGYDKGPDGNLVVNREQAKIVKLIYRLYLSGYTFHSIASDLTERSIKTPAGCDVWSPSTVRSILTNEKYKGDALLQKRYTVDFLTKKTKANQGEVPQYYVENDHEAIISPQVFDWTQEEIQKRGRGGKRHSGISIFSSKIKCGDCGSWYGAKVWHSNDKYRRTIYRCNDKFKHHCKTPHLTEEDIKAVFVKAVNKLMGNKNEIISNIQLIREQLCDTANLESEQDRLNQDLITLTDMTENCIAENARVSQDQMEYQERYNSLVSRYDRTKEQYETVTARIKDNRSRNEQLGIFIDNLKGQNLIEEFDKRLWCSLVDYITVYSKNDIRVIFKDGTEIRL
jgi:DNA invertase Pin-like site-specific DNA recombinase/FtsZ-binding cell division protein ZapB